MVRFLENKNVEVDYPNYTPSSHARRVLVEGNILAYEEQPQELPKRVADAIFSVERELGIQAKDTQKIAEEFLEYFTDGYLIPGTPLLTNAGRQDTALSSCAIIPINLRAVNKKTREDICAYYQQNMGLGFNFTPYNNPIELLQWINDLSIEETATKTYDRYIGNMGLLHITHPKIQDFIQLKRQREIRHFNISVDITSDFMGKAAHNETFQLTDGTWLSAAELLQQIADNAWYNGDPGLVSLERMNQDNPLTKGSAYTATPPCAEMGLAEGETCHFGYINLRKLVKRSGNQAEVDYDKLKRVTQVLTRALDNAVEYSIPRYPTQISSEITKEHRKLGIGVCGLADMLLAFHLPYDSQGARTLTRDILSFINYTSKWASVDLAFGRGACLAMKEPADNKYLSGTFLEDKYGQSSTNTVTIAEWKKLANKIRDTGNLRNISTTALPPTGRSSILLNTTSSIEPFFSIFDHTGNISQTIREFLYQSLDSNTGRVEEICVKAAQTMSFQNCSELPQSLRSCLKTARELTPQAHIQMVAALAGVHGVVDESASKTINLSYTTTVDEVKEILFRSYEMGLKNISLYRDRTNSEQPISLS